MRAGQPTRRSSASSRNDDDAALRTPSLPLDLPELPSAMFGLYKALYDYAPQDPETELALAEDQVLYILDKEDAECVSARPAFPLSPSPAQPISGPTEAASPSRAAPPRRRACPDRPLA